MLHSHKIDSIDLVVIPSQFVLHIVVIENSDLLDHHSPKELLSWSHWAQLIVPSPHQVAPLSRKVTYSTHISATAPQRLSWLTKTIVRKTVSIVSQSQSESTVFRVLCFWAHPWTMESLHGKLDTTFCEFHQHLFRQFVPISLWTVFFHGSLLLGTWTNKWPLSCTKLLCKYGNDLSICQTFFFIVFLVTGNVVEHRNEQNSSCESFWCSWENVPLEFSRLSTDPSQSLQLWEIVIHPILSFQDSLDFGCWWTLPRHNTESEKTWTFARWRLMIASSPINDRYFYEFFSQRIESTLKISSCSLTNFADMSNIFFSVRSDVFMMEFWLSCKFLPMNVAALIVTAINIPQIIECSSPSFATLDILFCLSRTWSFTRFTNSAASLPMMKLLEATSWELTLPVCPDVSRSGSPYLTDCALPSRRVASWWGRVATFSKKLCQIALIDRAS